MNEEVEIYLDEARTSMAGALNHLENELTRIRAGKASPDMLSGLKVTYYGMETPINQACTIKSLDARTLVISPFEKGLIGEIEKAIFQANLGVTPQNDGEVIRLILPPTTEERRRDLVKNSKAYGEQAKVSIRNVRKDANEGIRDLVKEGLSEDEGKSAEEEIQTLTNNYIKKVDDLLAKKEVEIMTV
jgi:ribosome recycling factor